MSRTIVADCGALQRTSRAKSKHRYETKNTPKKKVGERKEKKQQQQQKGSKQSRNRQTPISDSALLPLSLTAKANEDKAS